MTPTQLRRELLFNARYLIAGLINTFTGLAAIWLYSLVGAPLVLANALGFATGLLVAFFLSKRMVFRSEGPIKKETLRYALSFALSYGLNLIVLQICHRYSAMPDMLAQTIAVSTYIVCMYGLQRLFVFKDNTL